MSSLILYFPILSGTFAILFLRSQHRFFVVGYYQYILLRVRGNTRLQQGEAVGSGIVQLNIFILGPQIKFTLHRTVTAKIAGLVGVAAVIGYHPVHTSLL